MKTILLYCMIIGFSLIGTAQNEFEIRTVHILPSSELTITGDTNINKFMCQFNSSLLERSKKIKFHARDSKVIFKDAVLVLKNEGFDCGNKAINKDFHALLQTEKYSEIALELEEVNLQDQRHATAKVKIRIAGKQKHYTIPVEVFTSPVNCFVGKLKLDINDFDLKPPKKMFGLIVVKEEIEINFNLLIKNQIEELSAEYH